MSGEGGWKERGVLSSLLREACCLGKEGKEEFISVTKQNVNSLGNCQDKYCQTFSSTLRQQHQVKGDLEMQSVPNILGRGTLKPIE